MCLLISKLGIFFSSPFRRLFFSLQFEDVPFHDKLLILRQYRNNLFSCNKFANGKFSVIMFDFFVCAECIENSVTCAVIFISDFGTSDFYLIEDNMYFGARETQSTENFLQQQTLNPEQCEKGFAKNVKPFQCENCGRSYQRPKHLRAHKLRECGIEPQLKCPFCPMKTKRKENLKRHIGLIHPNNFLFKNC